MILDDIRARFLHYGDKSMVETGVGAIANADAVYQPIDPVVYVVSRLY